MQIAAVAINERRFTSTASMGDRTGGAHRVCEPTATGVIAKESHLAGASVNTLQSVTLPLSHDSTKSVHLVSWLS